MEEWQGKIHAIVSTNIPAVRAAADLSARQRRSGQPLSYFGRHADWGQRYHRDRRHATEQGSPLFKAWQSWRDSACVVALREAGAVIVGKTVITEFAAVTPGPIRNLGTRRGTQVDRAAAPPLLWPPGSYQQRLGPR